MAVLATTQTVYQVLTCIGYTIAAAESLESIVDAACGRAHCIKQWQTALAFGGCQVLMSLLPNLESAVWSSVIGAIMSIGYCVIALGLSASMAKNGLGSVAGRTAPLMTKVTSVFSSLGSIGFAYG